MALALDCQRRRNWPLRGNNLLKTGKFAKNCFFELKYGKRGPKKRSRRKKMSKNCFLSSTMTKKGPNEKSKNYQNCSCELQYGKKGPKKRSKSLKMAKHCFFTSNMAKRAPKRSKPKIAKIALLNSKGPKKRSKSSKMAKRGFFSSNMKMVKKSPKLSLFWAQIWKRPKNGQKIKKLPKIALLSSKMAKGVKTVKSSHNYRFGTRYFKRKKVLKRSTRGWNQWSKFELHFKLHFKVQKQKQVEWTAPYFCFCFWTHKCNLKCNFYPGKVISGIRKKNARCFHPFRRFPNSNTKSYYISGNIDTNKKSRQKNWNSLEFFAPRFGKSGNKAARTPSSFWPGWTTKTFALEGHARTRKQRFSFFTLLGTSTCQSCFFPTSRAIKSLHAKHSVCFNPMWTTFVGLVVHDWRIWRSWGNGLAKRRGRGVVQSEASRR